MSPPVQPSLPEAAASSAKDRRDLVQNHRQAVLDYARAHPGEWVVYWTSPTKVTARSVKGRMKQFTVGSYPVQDRDYAMHGHWSDEGWSLRINGTSTEVRYNGPFSAGMSPVPEWRTGRGSATLPE